MNYTSASTARIMIITVFLAMTTLAAPTETRILQHWPVTLKHSLSYKPSASPLTFKQK